MGANEKHQAAYHGVLSVHTVRGRYCDGTYRQTGHTTDGEEFDRWLAGVKAKAWDEGQQSWYATTKPANPYKENQ